ncbi:MAG: DUF6484 domain-containing protein [Gammaproteobacteria bacterium]|nr:DUF6484 domain-containing protein [Gammaproteobacteria bacterium]
MPSAIQKLRASAPTASEDFTGTKVGRIVRLTEGCALVDYPGNPGDPIKARSAITSLDGYPANTVSDLPVLILFENGDPFLPIIVSVIHDEFVSAVSPASATMSMGRPQAVLLDGKRVTLDATNEIVLRCGRSSVTLRSDGKIVVKGTQILSRASEKNKIKGASVSIN